MAESRQSSRPRACTIATIVAKRRTECNDFAGSAGATWWGYRGWGQITDCNEFSGCAGRAGSIVWVRTAAGRSAASKCSSTRRRPTGQQANDQALELPSHTREATTDADFRIQLGLPIGTRTPAAGGLTALKSSPASPRVPERGVKSLGRRPAGDRRQAGRGIGAQRRTGSLTRQTPDLLGRL